MLWWLKVVWLVRWLHMILSFSFCFAVGSAEPGARIASAISDSLQGDQLTFNRCLAAIRTIVRVFLFLDDDGHDDDDDQKYDPANDEKAHSVRI